MEWEVELAHDEALDLTVPHVRGPGRPDAVLIRSDNTVGLQSTSEVLDATYVRLEGTELFVPRRRAFVAFGGDLPFDVVFVIYCDGRTNTLSEVRFLQRPDRSLSLSTTTLRSVRLQPLIERALRQRNAFVRKADTSVVWIRTEEQRLAYLTAVRRSRGEARRRVPEDELQKVAEAYRRAVGVENPTAAVQRVLRYRTRDVAKKRVKQARDRGYLEPAPGERRGGLRVYAEGDL